MLHLRTLNSVFERLNLENDYTICQEDASDINSDGVVDILDVVVLINIILDLS